VTQDARESVTALTAVLAAAALFLLGMWTTSAFNIEIPNLVVHGLIVGYVAVAYQVVRHVRKGRSNG
jgi:VIT1/CCC1 family predicted Fe2+/Mn2+ transporter